MKDARDIVDRLRSDAWLSFQTKDPCEKNRGDLVKAAAAARAISTNAASAPSHMPTKKHITANTPDVDRTHREL